jgi:hypothetical protein
MKIKEIGINDGYYEPWCWKAYKLGRTIISNHTVLNDDGWYSGWVEFEHDPELSDVLNMPYNFAYVKFEEGE